MAYQINKSDGTLLAEVADSEVNNTASSLSLIGKNVTGYGEYVNENFIKLLENFSSTTEPQNPITGQIWFDTSEGRLKVYDDAQSWIPASGPFISPYQPVALKSGDFWINTSDNLLYYVDHLGNTQLASKQWKNSQGKSGLFVETLADQFGNQKTVSVIYNGGESSRVGIFSHNSEFTPIPAIAGFDSIKPGFNIPANISNYKISGVAAGAEALVDSAGNTIYSEDFLRINDNYVKGKVFIQNSAPLTLGVNNEVSVLSSTEEFKIRSNKIRQNMSLVVNTSDDAVFINALTKKIGIFTRNPRETLDIRGNAVIEGNLTVNGGVTTINSVELSVDDKLITLADTNTPSDIAADGGGFVLKGNTDHYFTWSKDTATWNSSEGINLQASSFIAFNSVPVLTRTTLGSSVTSATGLTEIGILNSLRVDNITLNSDTISTEVGDLVLKPVNGSAIDCSNSRIANLSAPVELNDAVTKQYVDDKTPSSWTEVIGSYTTIPNQRLLVGTVTKSFEVSLPANPVIGSTIRIIDRDSSFNVNPLTIARHRRPFVSTNTASAAKIGTFSNVSTVTVEGSGTGLTLDITILQTGTYQATSVSVTQAFAGTNYANNDVVVVKGSKLGGIDGVNDLRVTIGNQDNILNTAADLVLKTKNAAIELVYIGEPGWVRSEAFSEMLVPLSLPKFTTDEINSMPVSASNIGEVVYNTTTNNVYVYTNVGWSPL